MEYIEKHFNIWHLLTVRQMWAEVVDQGVVALSTELPLEVVEVQRPDKSPSKTFAFQVVDLNVWSEWVHWNVQLGLKCCYSAGKSNKTWIQARLPSSQSMFCRHIQSSGLGWRHTEGTGPRSSRHCPHEEKCKSEIADWNHFKLHVDRFIAMNFTSN